MIERPFFLMRILLWLLLILAAWGILQYCMHAYAVLRLQHVQPVAISTFRQLLAWDALYVLVAGLIVMASAGCLMWRPWARRWLRGLVFAMALYSLASAVVLFAQWQGTDPSGMDMLAPQMDPQIARAMATRARRILLMAAILKAAATPFLAWLGWRLGQADVRRRFER